jgi:hypothetical protein
MGTKFGWFRLELACRRAVAFELINVRRVESILLQDLDQFTLPLDTRQEPQVIPIARFQRPQESFSHHTTTETARESDEVLP